LYKIVSLSPFPASLVRSFFAPASSKLGLEIEVVAINKFDMNLFQRELPTADFVVGDFSFAIPITAEMAELMKKVKLIQQPSTGYDHIDIQACRKKGIPVANIGGANSISVAEYTIAVALLLEKRIMYSHNKLLQGQWAQSELMSLPGELNGKIWGVIGLGRIGKAVSSRAEALGASVIYYDILRVESEEEKFGLKYRELPKLLSESDVVSIHTPLTKETTKLIGERELRMMKPTSVIVNPARGEIVDEDALAKAVMEGWIAGAGVDVYTAEPPPTSHPLILAAREGAPLVLTSHIAGATNEARQRIIQFAIENIVRTMLGQKPENVVNP
jgi:phosphoglycerate dehydrogenase-like enzyme